MKMTWNTVGWVLSTDSEIAMPFREMWACDHNACELHFCNEGNKQEFKCNIDIQQEKNESKVVLMFAHDVQAGSPYGPRSRPFQERSEEILPTPREETRSTSFSSLQVQLPEVPPAPEIAFRMMSIAGMSNSPGRGSKGQHFAFAEGFCMSSATQIETSHQNQLPHRSLTRGVSNSSSMDITRGSLDDITRPARSSRHRPGSRVSINSPLNRPLSVASSSLEILPPDPDLLLQEDDDLAVVEFLNSSEEEEVEEGDENHISDIGRSGGVFNARGVQDRLHNLDLLLAKTNNENEDFSLQDTDNPSNLRELTYETPFHEDDQERSGRSSSRGQSSENQEGRQDEGEEEEDPDADLAAITDPELRKAIKKMRKLDRILNTRVTREKEVKRQRKILHHQLEVELDAIKEEGGGKSKEASENTTRFLALVPPVSHDEGVNMADIPSTPVFATQPPEGSSPSHKTSSSSEHSSPGRSVRQDRRASKTSPRDQRKRPRPPGAGNQGRKEDEPDFIQRNIQLASDAGNLMAMTDDEKKRLEDLLSEVDVLAGEEDEGFSGNNLQLKLIPGTGYTPDTDSQMLLQDIDEKLKNLLPSDDFMDICSTPSMLGDRRESFNPAAFDLGERILKETKTALSQQQRLKDIEQELANLQDQVENEISSPSLSKAQLNSLLQRCSDASDRTMTEITSPRLQQTASSLHSNQSSPRTSSQQASPRMPGQGGSQMSSGVPPSEKLSDDALQQLLSEAKASLGLLALENADSSRASSRTTTTVMTGRESASQLGFSLGDSPRSEMSMNTSRSLVSHDVIQQLLKNPRATLLQSSLQDMTENHEEREVNTDQEREMADDELNASLDM